MTDSDFRRRRAHFGFLIFCLTLGTFTFLESSGVFALPSVNTRPPQGSQTTPPPPVRSIRVFSAVPSQNTSAFKGGVEPDLAIAPNEWGETAYHMTTRFERTVSAAPGHRVVLAGGEGGTERWSVNNFLFVEIESSAGADRFIIGGGVGPPVVFYRGQPVQILAKGPEQGPFDLSRFIAGRGEVRIKIWALDYGGIGLVSDLFLVIIAPRQIKPGSEAATKVLFVRQTNAGFEPIKELVYDKPFYVEAHFDVPPTENRKEVKLEWATGQTRAVVVTKTEKDPKVFRSEKITPKRPAASASETTPANTPSPRINPNRTTPNPPNNSATTPSRSENASPLYRVVGVKANDQLTMRSGPGANNAEVGQILPGATGVKSLGEERQLGTNTWVKVNYRGVVGWVNRSFLARQ